MAVDEEIITRFNELKTTVNSIRNFDLVLPSDIGSIEMLIQFIAYFINPLPQDLDNLCAQYGIFLSEPEKKAIYPLIIRFIIFVKNHYLPPIV